MEIESVLRIMNVIINSNIHISSIDIGVNNYSISHKYNLHQKSMT